MKRDSLIIIQYTNTETARSEHAHAKASCARRIPWGRRSNY